MCTGNISKYVDITENIGNYVDITENIGNYVEVKEHTFYFLLLRQAHIIKEYEWKLVYLGIRVMCPTSRLLFQWVRTIKIKLSVFVLSSTKWTSLSSYRKYIVLAMDYIQ